MTSHLPLPAGPELLSVQPSTRHWYAVTHHVLPLGQDLEERIMPLHVGVQQVSGGEGSLAEGTHVPVLRVVVMILVL